MSPNPIQYCNPGRSPSLEENFLKLFLIPLNENWIGKEGCHSIYLTPAKVMSVNFNS